MSGKGSFLVFADEDFPWNDVPAGWNDGQAAQEPSLRYKKFVWEGEGLPSVSLTEYEPHHVNKRHRHTDSEVLMLYQGELEVDGTVHTAPCVIYVERGTLYGPLTAGPEGTRFFRVGWTPARPGATGPDAAPAAASA